MMNKITLLCIGFVAATVLAAPKPQQYGGDSIRLQDIGVLQFNVGEYAVNTRTPESIPRVTCAYNPLGDDNYLPTSVICKNKGLDESGSIIWKCEANMDSSLDFDNIQISCEGYNYPGDEFVRKGSCALTYTLKTTPNAKLYNQQQQQQQQPAGMRNPPPPPPPPHRTPEGYHNQQPRGVRDYKEHYRTPETTVRAVSGWTFSNVLILVLVVVLIYRCCIKKRARKTTNENENNNDRNVEKNTYDNVSNNDYGQPSAPPYEDVEGPSGHMSKRSGYANSVIR